MEQFWGFCVSLAALVAMVNQGLGVALKKKQLKDGTLEQPHHIGQPVHVKGELQTSPAVEHAKQAEVNTLAANVATIAANIAEMKLAAVERVAAIKAAFADEAKAITAEAARMNNETLQTMQAEFKAAYQRINNHGEKLAAHEKQLELLAKSWRS